MIGPLYTKFDVVGGCAMLLGATLCFFLDSNITYMFMSTISAVCFLYSSFGIRKKALMYKKAVTHYKSVLSASIDPWISWNERGEMVGASKQIYKLFNITDTENITEQRILSAINENDAKELCLKFDDIKNNGKWFSLSASINHTGEKVELVCIKNSVNDITTISLWIHNITVISKTFSTMQSQLNKIQSENSMLHAILDEMSMPVWYRSKDLKIVYCNNAYAKVVELSKANVVDKNIPLISGSLFGQGHSLAENAQKTGLKQAVSQFSIINGMRRKLDVKEIPVSSGMVGYADDVTELDDALKNMDKMLSAQSEILESLSSPIAIFDRSMRLTFYNSSYKRLTKFDEIWLNSKPSYIDVLDRQRMLRQLPEVADFNEYKQSQVKMLTSITAPMQDLLHLPNGAVIRRYIAPYKLGGLIFICDDITDVLTLKRENNSIVAVRNEILNNLVEGICVLGSDNKIKIVNPKMQYLFGVSDDNVGMHISDFLEMSKEQLSYFEQWDVYKDSIISNLTDRIMKTGRLTKKDGRVIFFSYTPLPDGSHMHSYTDVTDTCRVALALYEKEQAINASNNIRDEFVASVSSEIKESINLIIGFVDLLIHQYSGALNEKQVQYCDNIMRSARNLLSFLSKLSEMNSLDIDSIPVTIAPFDLRKAFDDTINSLRNVSSKYGVVLNYNYNSDRSIINADKMILIQVLRDICSNYISASEYNDYVSVDVSLQNNELVIAVENCSQRNYRQPNVRIFRRVAFEHIAKLSIVEQIEVKLLFVKALIEKHGGTVSFESCKNKKIVTCVIPLKENDEYMLAS